MSWKQGSLMWHNCYNLLCISTRRFMSDQKQKSSQLDAAGISKGEKL